LFFASNNSLHAVWADTGKELWHKNTTGNYYSQLRIPSDMHGADMRKKNNMDFLCISVYIYCNTGLNGSI